MKHKLVSLDNYTEAISGFNQFQQIHEPDSHHQGMIITLKKVYQGELTPRQQECLYLYHDQNKKMVEISDLLGINVSTVSRHIQKAHHRLKSIMNYHYPR